MKTNSPELFELIKSLNKQEKKRIRKELSLNKKDRNLSMLYDIIDKQKEFNDEIVQNKLAYPKWYPQQKKQLLEKITDKVFGGYYDRSKKPYVLKLILVADLFSVKGLIKQAKKKLEQAMVICREHEWLEFMPIINIRLSSFIAKKYSHKVNCFFYSDAYKTLEQFYLENKYHILSIAVEFSDTPEQAAEVLAGHKIDDYLSDEKHLTTLHQKLYYYSFLGSYFKLIELNYSQCYFYSKKNLEMVLEINKVGSDEKYVTPEQRYVRERSNIIGLANVIITAVNANILSHLNDEFRSYVELEREFKIGKRHDLYAFYDEILLFLYFLVSAKKITRGGVESYKFNIYLNKLYLAEKKLPHRMLVNCRSLISLYFFMKGKWNDCINTANRILNDNEVYKTYPEAYASALLLQLFVNYEVDDIDSLDYNLKKSERYFENHYSGLGYEKLILSFFNEVVIMDYSERIKIIKKYRERINHLLLNDKNLFLKYITAGEFIDFESWLDSKIVNRPFIDVVKEKAEVSQVDS